MNLVESKAREITAGLCFMREGPPVVARFPVPLQPVRPSRQGVEIVKPALLTASDREGLAGESLADDALAKIKRGASDPGLLLRLVLGLLAEQGYVVMPADMLRAAVRVVQKRIERGVANATG